MTYLLRTPSSHDDHARRWPQAAGRVGIAVAVALLAGACAPAPEATAPVATQPVVTGPTETTAAAAPSAAQADFARTFDIGGGRKMYLECSGSGSPTVILVSGQRASAQEWHTSQSAATPPAGPVFEEVVKTNRVCAYDRPGTPVGESFSRSDPVPQPTTAGAAATDLQALLAAAGEAGPFILVGHSVGGMVVRLFAGNHPELVQGMVLIDPPSEFLQDNETPEQWPIQRMLMEGDMTESLVEYPDIERIDVDASLAQLRTAPKLRPMPLTLLSADEPLGPQFAGMIKAGQLPAGVPADFGYTFDVAMAKAQARLAQLVPGATHITKTHSSHNIHMIQPQLVVEAIHKVVEQIGQQQ